MSSLFQCARHPEDIIQHLKEQKPQFSSESQSALFDLEVKTLFDNLGFLPLYFSPLTTTDTVSQLEISKNRERIEAFIEDRAEKFCDELETIIALKEKTEFAVFDRSEVAFWYKVAFLTHVFQMRKLEGKMYVHHVEQVTLNFLKYALRQIPRTGKVFDLTSLLVTHIVHDTKEDVKPQEESEIMVTHPHSIEFVQQLLRDEIGSVLRETEGLETEHILDALTKPITTRKAPKYPDAEFSAEISKEEKDVLTIASFVFQTLLHASKSPIMKALDRLQNMDSPYGNEKQLGKIAEVLVCVAPFLYATGNSELVTKILGKNIQLLDAKGREAFQTYFYWKASDQLNQTQSTLARFGKAEARPFDRAMFDYFRNNNKSAPKHTEHPLYKEYFFRDLHGSLMFYWESLEQAFNQHQEDGSLRETLKRVPLIHIGVEAFPEENEFPLIHCYPCGIRRIYSINGNPVLFYRNTPQPQKIFHTEETQKKLQNLLSPETWTDFQGIMIDHARMRDGFYYYSKAKLAQLKTFLPKVLGELNNNTIFIPEI